MNHSGEAGSRHAQELLTEARALFDSERDEAVRLVEQALAEVRAAKDRCVEAQALNLLSDAERMAGNVGRATELAQQALQSAEACGDERGQAAAFNSLAALSWHKGEFDRALELSRKALELRERLGDERGVASACGNLSLLHTEKGDLVRAMEYQQRCLALREKLGDSKGLGAAHLNMGVLLADLGDWDKALESYFRALAEKERAGDTADAALCCNNITEVYLGRGKLDRASFYLERALGLAENVKWVQAEVLGTMGDVAFAAGDFAEALVLYERDEAICTEIGEREELAETFRRIAEVHLAQAETSECRARLDEALALCTKAGLRREEGNVRRVMGELLAGTGDMVGARASFELSEAILKTVGKNYELGRTLLQMARCECRLTNEERRARLVEARAIFENLGAAGPASEAGEMLAKLAAPVETSDLLSGLTELACWNLGVAEFAQRGLDFIAGRLSASTGAVFLRDGRVFRAGKNEEGGERREEVKAGGASFALEAGGRRLGTLVFGGDVDVGRVKTAVDLFALGLAQAGQASAEVRSPKSRVPSPKTPGRFPGVVGADTTLREVFETIERVAPTKANVLVLGESGTGKEIVARTLHELSDRKGKPFVAVNCAAIPENLLESELFGIEKGTATGVAARIGRFEQAGGGTVFLDEIGDMSLGLQAKMLRVLQERNFERVGGREPVQVDVRIVAATNRDLESAMSEGRFRRDLFYRLNVVTVVLPRLRERKSDIPALVQHFVARVASEYGKPVSGVTDDCLSRLIDYAWPGNVRELENVIERGVILARGEYVTTDDLPPGFQPGTRTDTGWRDIRKKVEAEAAAPVEEKAVVAALEQSGWVVSRAADKLGISRRQLYRIMAKRGIRKPGRTD